MHVNKREQQAVGLIQLFPGRAGGLQDMASSGWDLPPSERFALAPEKLPPADMMLTWITGNMQNEI